MHSTNSSSADESVAARAAIFLKDDQFAIYRWTDRFFSVLLPVQWLAGIFAAYYISPYTWKGIDPEVHPHVWLAIIVGGAITTLPLYLTLARPGQASTRHIVAISQMLMSGLLIHILGGRIETHFHIFGSLAFLSCYRDWRVLVSATVVTTADHLIRGWLYPFSAYGVLTGAEWRWLEHAGWVVFTDLFLVVSSLRSVKEMKEVALRGAVHASDKERYRAIVEQTSDGIVLLEPKTLKVVECNDALRRLLGCSSIEEAKTLTAYDVTTVSADELSRLADSILRDGKSFKGERLFRRLDGSTVPVDITVSVISFHGERIFSLNVKDISERKQADEEIKRLALVAQKTQNSVVVCSREGYIQWVNEGFTRLTGYTFAEVSGKSPLIFCGEQTDPDTLLEMLSAIGDQRPFEGELYYYRKDGTCYWVSSSLMPLTDEAGETLGYISIEMDITQRKEMEERLRGAHTELELRVEERTAELVAANATMQAEVNERKSAQAELNEAKEFLYAVIDNVPSLIFVKDLEGKYVLGNRAFAEARGTTVEKLIGNTRADYGGDPDEVQRATAEDIALLTALEDKFLPEEMHRNADGTMHWYQTSKRSVVIGKKAARFLLGVSTDLTERRHMEGQLQHAQKMESIGQLAAGIAHEINTPTQYVGDNTRFIRDAFADLGPALASYGDLLDAVEKGDVDPELIAKVREAKEKADIEYLLEEVPNAVQQSLDGVSRIGKIVQSMKEFAHPGAREKQSADLNRAIESTVTVARNEWKYVADLETNFDPSLPAVPCFLGEFNQVVLNMVINAAHAIADVVGDGSGEKGKITITTTHAENGWAEVRIGDTGNGIPAEIRNRIFDPFFTTKGVGKGSGQGLAISHAVVVEKHGGQLSFETEPGQGTTFIIKLPLNSEAPAKGVFPQ